jgi:hypothetical protein
VAVLTCLQAFWWRVIKSDATVHRSSLEITSTQCGDNGYKHCKLLKITSVFQRKDWWDYIRIFNLELLIRISWYEKPLYSATWKALVPTKGCLMSPTVNPEGLILFKLVEADPKKAAKSTQQVVSNSSRLFWLKFSCFFLVGRQMTGYN